MLLEPGKSVKKWVGKQMEVIDAEGHAVIPGLTDAHLHPEQASVSEFHSKIPHVQTIDELLLWIRQQTAVKSKDK